jgi:hypothetical protein
MTAVLPYIPLTTDNTVEAEHIHHRLALGVQWRDALTGLPADGRWVSELQKIGTREIVQRLDLHPVARHAVRLGGRLAAVLVNAAADKVTTPPPEPKADQTNFVLKAWGEAQPSPKGYGTGNDPRRFVPRRLSFTPVQTKGVPTSTAANIRTALLWPGANYPLAGSTTAVRGRIRRGPAPDKLVPVAWARVVITRPAAIPDFATEPQLAWAHGDDRGEFIAVLGPGAVPGGATLPATLALRVWVFLPATDAFDPKDPLASLPLDVAGVDATNDVLDGKQVPSSYLTLGPIDITPTLGRVFTMSESDLTFS